MKIAVTYTDSEEKHHHYVRWLKGNDDVEVVKLFVGDNNIQQVLQCDALVLSGGRDIHPKFYGYYQVNYPNAPKDFDIERDAFEIAAFQLAQQKGLPVLGICRGLQLVNCIQGGTLKQDLGEDLNKTHKAATGVDQLHRLHIHSQTQMAEITQSEGAWVNSAHHQAIDTLGNELRVNCVAEDGTIEGVEWANPTGKPFLLCVQWHPERMGHLQLENAPSSQAIRYGFLKEIEKSKRNQ